uniref:Uncharacterized protein n=1 Tax=Vombatus ursinus TaxID=29139 RepID=A0A4X2LTH2_VOMUR
MGSQISNFFGGGVVCEGDFHSQITISLGSVNGKWKTNGSLNVKDFQGIPKLADNFLEDLVINDFFPKGDDQIKLHEFISLAHFQLIQNNEKSKDVNRIESFNKSFNSQDIKKLAFSFYYLYKDDKISQGKVLEKVGVKQMMRIHLLH